jgi:hypothetical protein
MTTITEPVVENLRDSPDISILKAMETPIVIVTKISPTGKKGTNRMVINGQKDLKWEEILALHDQLPLGTIPNTGPGLYKFEVTDRDTTSKHSWQIRLGNDTSETSVPELGRTNLLGASAAVAAAVAAPQRLPSDAQPLGNGWVYHPSAELLAAPDGSLYKWSKGMPLPAAATMAVQPPTIINQPASTPFGTVPSNPEMENMRQMLAATQASLAEAKARELEVQHQREIREMQDSFQKAIADNNARVEKLIETLAAPRSDSRVEEMERRLAEKERMDALRAEMKAQNDVVKAQNEAALRLIEVNQNKGPDPMIGVLTTMLADQRHSAEESIRAMRDLAAQERAAAKDTALTPERLFTMIEKVTSLTKDDSKADVVGKVLSGFDMLMDRLMKVSQMERELGGGGGPDWLAVIREVGNRAGSAFQMYQEAKAREANAVAATATADIVKARAAIAASRAAGPRPAPALAPAAPRPAAAPGAAAGVAPPSPAALAGTAAAPAGKAKKRVTFVDFEKAKTSELRALFKGEQDEMFFGKFLEYVQQLRDAVAARSGNAPAEEIANFVLEARALIKPNEPLPHAVELLGYGQHEYLMERILPAFGEGLRSEVVKAIKKLLAAEEDAARIARSSGAPVDTADEVEEEEEEEDDSTPATPEEPVVS